MSKILINQYLGKKYGRLTIIGQDYSLSGLCNVICICDCGKRVTKPIYLLKRGNTLSCGCLRRDINKSNLRGFKHGLCKKYSKEYTAWTDLRHRCTNINDKYYKDYGARGIKVCERWNDFKLFFDDMGQKKDGESIDRINVNGDYCPENCRWATNDQQANNKRIHHNITYNGIIQNITQWAKSLNISANCILYRISAGYDIGKILSSKNYRYKKNKNDNRTSATT